MRIYIESTTILYLQWKRSQTFLFFKISNTPHKGKTRYIALLSSFLFKVQCFYRDENDLVPGDKYNRKKERCVALATFWKKDNSNCFDIPIFSTESQVLYSFIIKVRMDTPIFYILIFS